MTHATATITDQTFNEQVLQSSKLVLVDYWAEWCGPCKMLGPVIDRAASEYADRLVVAKLNIDENPITPSRYSVRGIPTLMLFKDGQPVGTRVGNMSKAQLDAFIEEHAVE